jgi:hypothetical protein
MMSFFLPPLTRNKWPKEEISLGTLHRMLTSSEHLRQATERVRVQFASGNPDYYRAAKQDALPYVTPAGVFRYCKASDLVYLSGLVVVDIDKLPSEEEAVRLRDVLFEDPELKVELAFVSPSGRGVKLLVPYQLIASRTMEENVKDALAYIWGYLEVKYEVNPDRSGCDIARTCLLSFDPDAKIRV